jgi:dienelactone hydrolase
VYDQLIIVESKSPRFKKHIFRSAGHSWDCGRCREDGYEEEATRQALKMTLELFEVNKR